MATRTRERRKRRPDPGAARGGRALRLLVLSAAVAAMGPAHAQATFVQPSVTGRLSYTDNVNASERNPKSELIAEIAPAIAVSRAAGRVTGDFRAQIRSLMYVRDFDRSRDQLALSGRGRVELIQNRFFLDADAAVTHRNRSEFSGRSPDDIFDITGSGSETQLYSIGPRLQLPLFGEGSGSASYTSRWFTGDGALGERRVDVWGAQLDDPRTFGPFGWNLDYRRVDTRYDDLPDSEIYQQTTRATLYANLTRWLRLRAIGGRESTDYETGEGESGTIKGGGFDWHPTDRTFVTGTVEDRVFGRSFHLAINHSRRSSHWDLSYSKDFSSSLQSLFSIFDDPRYQALYEILPGDPLERETEARRILGLLDPTVQEGFITKAYYEERRLRAGVSLRGVRNVLSLSFVRSDRERLASFAPFDQAVRDQIPLDPRDDFARFDRVRTHSVSLAHEHRVSGNASVNARLTRSRAEGFGPDPRETRRWNFSLGMYKRISPRTSGSLVYRYHRAEGSTEFTENVVTASVDIRF